MLVFVGDSVQFPGAVNSKFTSDMSFATPSSHAAIPTFRVMDADGVVVDKSRNTLPASDEEVMQWYKNMVVGT